LKLRHDAALLIAGLVAGWLFFSSLSVLWPLADVDLVLSGNEVQSRARDFLQQRGFDLDGYRAASMLSVSESTLDYVERTFGRARTQGWIAEGLPLVFYTVHFKKRGEPVTYVANFHPEAGVIGWNKNIPEDYPGRRLTQEQARALALEGLTVGLRLDATEFHEQSASTSEQPERRTHEFVYEREISVVPRLRERVFLTVAGDEVVRGSRWLRVPDAAARDRRAAEAPGIAFETVGFALLAGGAIAAFFVFLRRLRDGSVRLGRAAVWPAAVFVCLLGTWALETPRLFRNWEPLWPQWVSNLRYLTLTAIQQAWLLVVLLAVVAAGQALDRGLGAGRGSSLWALARGRLFDLSVARASGRGFLVGLLCGGAMTLAVVALQATVGATTGIQPRGFFFYTLNSASPALASLLFFFGVALAEELGYRFFAGSWLLSLTGRKWIAVLLPAVVYGLSHTRLDFLPPAEPFWARAVVLTLVGCVWGWAFLRYDALTVVLSHFTADLFIFNWPRLASGQAGVVAVSVLTICVPLVPFALGAARRVGLGRSGRRG
jgi:membrane protease YdiL (CAAX protease family)